MSKYDLDELMAGSKPVADYMKSAGEEFIEHYERYESDGGAVMELERYVDGITVVAFSAEWCKDCKREIPVLAHLSEEIGLKVRVFGDLMRDAKSATRKWSIPPSPKEVEDFKVNRIPLIVVLDREGRRLGAVEEKPAEGKTLERALLDILRS